MSVPSRCLWSYFDAPFSRGPSRTPSCVWWGVLAADGSLLGWWPFSETSLGHCPAYAPGHHGPAMQVTFWEAKQRTRWFYLTAETFLFHSFFLPLTFWLWEEFDIYSLQRAPKGTDAYWETWDTPRQRWLPDSEELAYPAVPCTQAISLAKKKISISLFWMKFQEKSSTVPFSRLSFSSSCNQDSVLPLWSPHSQHSLKP